MCNLLLHYLILFSALLVYCWKNLAQCISTASVPSNFFPSPLDSPGKAGTAASPTVPSSGDHG